MCKKILVSGLVQGVGYRAYVHRIAWRLGLRGYVRNRLDGRVEALVCGPDEALSEIESAMRKGPIGARVESVEVYEAHCVSENIFEIQPTL